MKTNKDKQIYGDNMVRLSDLGIVTSLVAKGYNIIETKKDFENSSRVDFVFKKDINLDKLISGYFEGKLMVDAKKFWLTLRDIKSRIHITN